MYISKKCSLFTKRKYIQDIKTTSLTFDHILNHYVQQKQASLRFLTETLLFIIKILTTKPVSLTTL